MKVFAATEVLSKDDLENPILIAHDVYDTTQVLRFGMKTVSQWRLIPYMVQSIQELDGRLTRAENTIDTLIGILIAAGIGIGVLEAKRRVRP